MRGVLYILNTTHFMDHGWGKRIFYGAARAVPLPLAPAMRADVQLIYCPTKKRGRSRVTTVKSTH